jgi:hypothetical protein
MCQNILKRNHVYDFSLFYSDTHIPFNPSIYAAFIEEYTSFSSFERFAATDLLALSLFSAVTFSWG